jgi:ABC-type phosphate/phosphonate transport system permease subunit
MLLEAARLGPVLHLGPSTVVAIIIVAVVALGSCAHTFHVGAHYCFLGMPGLSRSVVSQSIHFGSSYSIELGGILGF